MTVISAVGVDKRLGAVLALHDVSIEVAAGESVAITGPSGAGKSTLLHLLGAMDRPSSGRVVVDGVDTSGAGDEALTLLRRQRLGFVFQFFHLLPTLGALDNVAVPAILDGTGVRRARQDARASLGRVGLGHRLAHRPTELSGGEQQRVAIARALAGDPVVVLADEPTGNLDSATSAEVLDLLRHATVEDGRSLVLVSHDPTVAATADRVVALRDGTHA